MKELRERILSEGVVQGNILKVGTFLNQVTDVALMKRMGENFAEVFRPLAPTKVLTIETSGIAPAMMTALALDIPLATARKHEAANLSDTVLLTDVYSYTKQRTYKVMLEAYAIKPNDRVLIIDDFLARGHAVLGMLDLIEQAGAEAVGVGIVIEKSFEPGHHVITKMNLPLHSLAVITALGDGKIEFAE